MISVLESLKDYPAHLAWLSVLGGVMLWEILRRPLFRKSGRCCR